MLKEGNDPKDYCPNPQRNPETVSDIRSRGHPLLTRKKRSVWFFVLRCRLPFTLSREYLLSNHPAVLPYNSVNRVLWHRQYILFQMKSDARSIIGCFLAFQWMQFWNLYSCSVNAFVVIQRPSIGTSFSLTAQALRSRQNFEDTEDNSSAYDAEIIDQDDNEESPSTSSEDENWLPDREKAKRRKEASRIYAERVSDQDSSTQKETPSAYTDEEEEVIAAMGGKTKHPQRKREIGFLGDSTLSEITTDYSVPICYLADVLCMWGVPVPINPQDRLGDLVTGEQAFAILEAVNSLDVSALHDRYSNTSLLNLCAEWDIDLQKAFELAVKEGWSLPFGVQTCLRVEQEDELLRVLGGVGADAYE